MFPDIQIDGMDISETAVEKAKKTFPSVKFFCGNITDFSYSLGKRGEYDLIILSEILWYILNDLDTIIKNIKNNFKRKFLLINQTFYKDGEQKYGRDFFTTPEEMISYFDMECIALTVSHVHGDKSYGCHTSLRVK